MDRLHRIDVGDFDHFERGILMKLWIARIGLRGALKIGAGLAVAALAGWLYYQWTTGQAAKIQVQELRQEIRAIEQQVEHIETLTERLDEVRRDDTETREVIRSVPDNRLTPQDQDAARRIFP